MGAVLILGLVGAACGGDDDSSAPDGADETAIAEVDTSFDAETLALAAEVAEAEQVAKVTYVGTVEGTDAYVAVVAADDGTASVYVCDGAAVSAWSQASVADGSIAGDAIDATIDGDAVRGTVAVQGVASPFTASAATHPSGLFEAFVYPEDVDDEVAQAERLRVGWIVLADGSQRGAGIKSGKIVPVVGVSPNLPEVQVPGGTATPAPSGGEAVPTDLNKAQCNDIKKNYQRTMELMIAAKGKPAYDDYYESGIGLFRLYYNGGCKGITGDEMSPIT